MTEAFVTPELVRWAREREGLDFRAAAQRIPVKAERFESWEKGTARPTFHQAEELARKLHVPFGYLFLHIPPIEEPPLPDLRTISNRPPGKLSPELTDVLQDALRKQEWYRDYQEEEEIEPLAFAGRYTAGDSPNDIAADIRHTLQINVEMRHTIQNLEAFLRLLIHKAEQAGILVLRNGVVGNNNRRPLDPGEFQGFAISDDLAPLVFINGQDWKSAQIFTFVHELAHLWIGKSGISNLDYRRRSFQQQYAVEQLCDGIAAETLVPNSDFTPLWQHWSTVDENLDLLSRRYRVSRFVVLRRAYDNQILDNDQYWQYYDELRTKVTGSREKNKDGGNFDVNFLARNSSTLTLALLGATMEGRVPYRDAANLLNVNVGKLDGIYHRLVMRSVANA